MTYRTDGDRATRQRMGVAAVAGYITMVCVGKMLPGNSGGFLVYCLILAVYCIEMVPIMTVLVLKSSGRTQVDKWEVTGLLMLVGLGVVVVILLPITIGTMRLPLHDVHG